MEIEWTSDPTQPPRATLILDVTFILEVTSILGVTLILGASAAPPRIPIVAGRGASLFEPPLPQRQLQALRSNTMANFTKLFLQFDVAFWENSTAADGSIWAADGGGAAPPSQWLMGGELEGELVEWHNLDHPTLIPGSRTLVGMATGTQATAYETMPDAELRAVAMRRLRTHWPSAPEPVAFHATRHGLDPLSFGAYSANALGFDGFDLQQEPLRDTNGSLRVMFAGEHVCSSLQGYLQGAWESGHRAVTRWLLPAIGRGPPLKSVCDE